MKDDTQTGDRGMGALATRPVVPRELGPFRAGMDGPGDGAVGLRALRDVMTSGDMPVTADVPAVRGGVVSRCALFGRLFEAERVVQISAPAGSGKTVLMRSWIAEAGLGRPIGENRHDVELALQASHWLGSSVLQHGPDHVRPNS